MPQKTNVLPTAEGTITSGPNAFTSAVTARHPVQWAGTMRCNPKLRMSRSFRDHFHERLTRGVAEG